MFLTDFPALVHLQLSKDVCTALMALERYVEMLCTDMPQHVVLSPESLGTPLVAGRDAHWPRARCALPRCRCSLRAPTLACTLRLLPSFGIADVLRCSDRASLYVRPWVCRWYRCEALLFPMKFLENDCLVHIIGVLQGLVH